jgi:hypothetical protein
MPNHGTESQFEATTIDRLLALLGYRYQYGGDVERDLREVVITDWLRAFLVKKYPELPAASLEEAIQRASRPEGITSEQRNKHFHELLTQGEMRRVLVAAFCEAQSYPMALALRDHIIEVTDFTDEEKTALRSACKDDDQVAGAWPVPEAIYRAFGKPRRPPARKEEADDVPF